MKHYLSVASVFKNESWNLKEWVLHYKHHGFDHIYLVNDFSDDDYLLLMGDPSAIGIACAVASSNNRGRFKCLKWDKREYKYYPVEVNLYEKGEIDE